MAVIHHGLNHPGVRVMLLHKPADVGHRARTRGGKDDEYDPSSSKTLPPPSSATHRHKQCHINK